MNNFYPEHNPKNDWETIELKKNCQGLRIGDYIKFNQYDRDCVYQIIGAVDPNKDKYRTKYPIIFKLKQISRIGGNGVEGITLSGKIRVYEASLSFTIPTKEEVDKAILEVENHERQNKLRYFFNNYDNIKKLSLEQLKQIEFMIDSVEGQENAKTI